MSRGCCTYWDKYDVNSNRTPLYETKSYGSLVFNLLSYGLGNLGYFGLIQANWGVTYNVAWDATQQGFYIYDSGGVQNMYSMSQYPTANTNVLQWSTSQNKNKKYAYCKLSVKTNINNWNPVYGYNYNIANYNYADMLFYPENRNYIRNYLSILSTNNMLTLQPCYSQNFTIAYSKVIYNRGNLIEEYVNSTNKNFYPENGIHTDGYWYTRKAVTETYWDKYDTISSAPKMVDTALPIESLSGLGNGWHIPENLVAYNNYYRTDTPYYYASTIRNVYLNSTTNMLSVYINQAGTIYNPWNAKFSGLKNDTADTTRFWVNSTALTNASQFYNMYAYTKTSTNVMIIPLIHQNNRFKAPAYSGNNNLATDFDAVIELYLTSYTSGGTAWSVSYTNRTGDPHRALIWSSPDYGATGILHTIGGGTERGNYISTVSDIRNNTYPDNGLHTDGYWYTKSSPACWDVYSISNHIITAVKFYDLVNNNTLNFKQTIPTDVTNYADLYIEGTPKNVYYHQASMESAWGLAEWNLGVINNFYNCASSNLNTTGMFEMSSSYTYSNTTAPRQVFSGNTTSAYFVGKNMIADFGFLLFGSNDTNESEVVRSNHLALMYMQRTTIVNKSNINFWCCLPNTTTNNLIIGPQTSPGDNANIQIRYYRATAVKGPGNYISSTGMVTNHLYPNNGIEGNYWYVRRQYQNVGGNIRYVNTDSTGCTYSFYDSLYDRMEVDDTNINSFDGATYYTKQGSGPDKYYVSSGVFYNNQWGATNNNTSILYGTIDGLGYGKLATQNMINFTNMTSYSSSIWNTVNGLRGDNFNGCNDWFVGSKVDYNVCGECTNARAALWAAVEVSNNSAWYWAGTYWNSTRGKSQGGGWGFVPLRSF